jgi:hypothetical protein
MASTSIGRKYFSKRSILQTADELSMKEDTIIGGSSFKHASGHSM